MKSIIKYLNENQPFFLGPITGGTNGLSHQAANALTKPTKYDILRRYSLTPDERKKIKSGITAMPVKMSQNQVVFVKDPKFIRTGN